MKRFLGYIYEYKQGKRSRNVGFARVEEKTDDEITGVLKLQGMQGKRRLDVYLIHEEEDKGKRIFFQSVQVQMDTVNVRFEWKREKQEPCIKVVGVYLEDDKGNTYAACWKSVSFSFADILWEDKEQQKDMPEELLKEVCLEESVKTADVERKEQGQEEIQELSELVEQENVVVSEEKEYQEKKEEPESVLEKKGQVEEQKGCAAQCEEQEKPKTLDQSVKIEKIQREEISKLPRCEWRLVNNNFLVHGWRNYHYLVLIEEDGKLFLGVPGIYHKKEADAALAFGFPQFRNAQGENEEEGFGYWCRQVRGSIIKS